MVLATTTLAVASVVLFYLLTRSMGTWLTWSTTRRWLQALIVADLGVLVLRWAAAFDARRTAALRHPPRGGILRRSGTLMMLTVLALFIAAPHLLVAQLATTQLGLLSDVFNASDTQTVKPTPITTALDAPTTATAQTESQHRNDTSTALDTPTTATAQTEDQHGDDTSTALDAPTTATAQTEDQHHGSIPTPETAHASTATTQTADGPSDAAHSADSPATVPAPPADWNGAERLTMVLLGSDGGYQRSGVRTDTIIVFSIDVGTGDTAAFNIPRNWKHVTFPEGTAASRQWPDGYPGIANEIYGLGVRYPDAFPGVEDKAGHAVKLAMAQLTGLDIQYYVMVDMVGFVKVVDLFGGIGLHVSESINDRIQPIEKGGPHIDIVVEPGEYHFDGLTALGYVRSRTQSSDWHRMTRQRCVIEALIDQVSPVEAVYRFGDLSGIISQHLVTDIPMNRLEDLVAIADSLDTSRIVTVNFIPPEFPRGDAPIPQVREAVTQALEGTTNESNTLLSDSCRGGQ